jgi:hypothetical protein
LLLRVGRWPPDWDLTDKEQKEIIDKYGADVVMKQDEKNEFARRTYFIGIRTYPIDKDVSEEQLLRQLMGMARGVERSVDLPPGMRPTQQLQSFEPDQSLPGQPQ